MELVVITGASSGVGAAAARAFHRQGARVILVARSGDRLARLSEELGVTVVAIPCDAADAAAVETMADTVLQTHGAPDVVVNCAGAGQWKTLPETSPDEAQEMMRAPYLAAFTVTRAFLPAMLARGRGVILSVNSPACIVPWPSSVGYTAARAALRGFHHALSQDLAGTEVRSCHVIFGRIDSEYFANNPGTAEKMPALARTIPTLSVEKCAEHLVHLAHYPRHTAIYPAILRLHCAVGVAFPRLARWILRQGGGAR